jgi:S-formylglutathione hydrolase FrmB
MLAGSPGQPADWTRGGGADQAADRFAASHRGVAPILVFADQNGSVLGDTECVDEPQGRAETYLAVDVRQHVISTYGASPDPARWGVAGLSEGGTCALTLTLRHPDLFHALGDFSGGLAPTLGGRAETLKRLFGGSTQAQQAYDPLTVLAHRGSAGLAAWFEAGADDVRPRAAARTLAAAAVAAGIDTHLGTDRGGHGFAFWAAAFNDALPWLAAHLGLGPPTPPIP